MLVCIGTLMPPLYEHSCHITRRLSFKEVRFVPKQVSIPAEAEGQAYGRDPSPENTVWWDGNRKLSQPIFRFSTKFHRPCARQQLFAQGPLWRRRPQNIGSRPVSLQMAWHSLFIRQLLIVGEVRT